MQLSDIDYSLPDRLIAQTPIEPRDSARLLVDRGSGAPQDAVVRDLPQFLRDGDLLVVNDTKVVPARLHLVRSTGGAVEVLLLEPLDDKHREWEALIRPGRKMKPGETLFAVDNSQVLEVHGRGAQGDTFRVTFVHDDPDSLIARLGEMPLPPYITQRLDDTSRYQTVYAREAKSAAAPTAGLHFTPELLAAVRAMGVPIANVELVVGLDTFAPVTTDDPRDHVIHTESYHVPPETLAAELQRFADNSWLNFVGGCCGTTPAHIAPWRPSGKRSMVSPIRSGSAPPVNHMLRPTPASYSSSSQPSTPRGTHCSTTLRRWRK